MSDTARVALVTGAGRNIGRAIALALAADGMAVVVNVRSNAAEGAALVEEIRAGGGTAELCLADVAERAAVDAMLAQVRSRFGRLDVLVNNAALRAEAAFESLDHAAWRRVLDVCLDGAFHCTQAALPLLKASGAAAIINIGGLTAHSGASQRAHVVTAKAGLVGLTRALAHELAAHGITVNCVAPGLIDTQRAGPAPHHHGRHSNLLGRRGTAEEVAQAVRWLAGPGARYITGQVVHANGGAYLGS